MLNLATHQPCPCKKWAARSGLFLPVSSWACLLGGPEIHLVPLPPPDSAELSVAIADRERQLLLLLLQLLGGRARVQGRHVSFQLPPQGGQSRQHGLEAVLALGRVDGEHQRAAATAAGVLAALPPPLRLLWMPKSSIAPIPRLLAGS